MKFLKIAVVGVFTLGLANCGSENVGFRPLGTLEEERSRCYNLSLPGLSSNEMRQRCDWVGVTQSKAMLQLATHHSDACSEILQTVLYACMVQVGERQLGQEAAKKLGEECTNHYNSTLEQSCGQFRF